MPDPVPTAGEFFGAPSPTAPRPPLPTASQFFAPAPQSGAASDTIWSSLQSAGARILNSAGFGFQNAWGDRPVGLDPDTDQSLRDAGVLPDYNKGNSDWFKAANEAVLRPAASFADMALRAIPAAAGAVESGAKQAVEEIEGNTKPGIGQEALALPIRVVGGLASGVTQGAFPDLPELSAVPTRAAVVVSEAERVTQAAAARSVAVMGEGEAGFFEAKPLTPDNVAARANAAQDAGIQTPSAPEPAPDIHVLARRVDPETFDRYDALAAARDEHRLTISTLAEQRAALPEAVEAKTQIDTILSRVNGVESRLTNVAAERLTAAQGRLDAVLHTDTPEMAQVRTQLLDADFGMRELAPEVSAAYRQARDMAPDLPESAAAQVEQEALGPPEPEPQEAPEQAHAEGEAAGATKEGAAEVSPPSVTGEQKLGEGPEVTTVPAQPPSAFASPEEPVPAEGGTPHPETEPGAEAEAPKPALARYGNLRAVEGTGETATRGLAQHVEDRAVEDGLTAAFGDLPEYERLSMKDQALKAQGLIASDYESAKDVALGVRQPPKGLLPESVFVAVEKQALAVGDVDTLRQLATSSRLTTAATTMGQRIRTLAERDPASPVGAIQAVQQAREVAMTRGGADLEAAKAQTASEIKDEIRATAQSAKPAAWADFMAQLRCDA